MFLTIGVLWGVVFCFVNPPYQVDDEYAHMWRVYELSTGLMVSRSDEQGAYSMYPSAALAHLKRYKYLRKAVDRHFDAWRLLGEDLDQSWQDEPQDRVANFAANYSIVNYAPQVVAVWFARTLGLPPLLHVYLARLSSLAAYLLLTAYALRLAGHYRWLMFALALMPMALWQGSGITADSMTNGLAFVVTAWFIHLLLYARGRLDARHWVATAVLAASLGLCKFAYVGLVLLTFVLPLERFGSRVRQVGISAAVTALALAPVYGWATLNRHLEPTLKGIDAGAQLALILNEPARLGRVLVATFSNEGWLYARTFVGHFGRYDEEVVRQLGLPSWVAVTYLLLLITIALVVTIPREARLRGLARWAFGLFALGTSLLIFLALYLLGTKVGSSQVTGVQGRYFVPLALPALAWLASWQKREHTIARKVPQVAAVVVNVALLSSLYVVVATYYL